MRSSLRLTARLATCLVVAVLVCGALAAPAHAQPDNEVKIMIVNKEIKIVNRGVGLCKSATADCLNKIVWKWQGADPNPNETEKIVISYVKGTQDAINCFQDVYGHPKLTYEILQLNSETSATVSADCPAKSAWLYQISCVRTDTGYEGQACTDIAPVDPGAVIG